MAEFVVALNSIAPAVRLPNGVTVGITGLPTRHGVASVRWFTRYADEGFRAPIPRELWVEVEGPAPDFDAARVELVELGRALSPLLALSANAAIEDPELELAFDSTPDIASRDFFQSMRPTDTGEPKGSRILLADSVAPLVNAVFGSTEADRLHRASVQYGEALKAWLPGRQLRSVMHLWMGVEALTKAALRLELGRLRIDRDRLLEMWGIDLNELDATVRRRLVFHGDNATYSELRQLSDAVEHSFENLAPLHIRAEAIRGSAASHLRRAILEYSGIPSELRDTLTSEPYDRPRESFSMSRYVRGRLVGEGAQLAADRQPYPFVHMVSRLAAFDANEDGSFAVTPSDTFTPSLGPGISLTDIRVEIWGPVQDPRTTGMTPEPDSEP